MNKFDQQSKKQKLDELIISQFKKFCRINYRGVFQLIDQNNYYGYTLAMFLTKYHCLVPKQWLHDYNIKNKQGQSLEDMMKEHYMPVPNEWQDEQKMTIFDKAYFGIIPNIAGHKSDEQDQQGFTVAMILTLNNIDIPKEWEHKPEIQNNYGYTVAMYQARNSKIPDKQWYHYRLLKSKSLRTVQDYLMYNNYDIPKEWQINSNKVLTQQEIKIISDYCDYYQIKQNLNILPTYNINQDGNTIAMYLLKDHEQIPEYFKHNSTICDNYGNTVAMSYAQKGKIPPKEWDHDPTLMNKNNLTVQDYLISKSQDIPQQWQVNINRILSQQEKQYIEQYCRECDIQINYQISKWYNINYPRQTIAMYLVGQKIVPPKIFMHDTYRRNIFGQSIQRILYNNNLPMPYHWNDNNMDIFDKACYGEIPNIEGHKPDEINQDKQTVAMILAIINKKIPDEWYHDPNLQDINGNTVAIYLAINGIIPPQQWYHDPQIHNKRSDTVAIQLIENHIMPPKEWCYDPNIVQGYKSIKQNFYIKQMIPQRYIIDISDNKNEVIQYFKENQFPIPSENQETDPTIFDIAMLGQIPDINGHIPDEQNEDGWTVAMILIFQKIDVPKQWQHDPKIKNAYNKSAFDIYLKRNIIPLQWCCQQPDYQDENGNTQAMIVADNNVEIPQYLYHDSMIKNNKNQTVAMFLSKHGNMPSKYWYHDPDMKDKSGNSIRYFSKEKLLPIPKHWNDNEMDIFDRACFGETIELGEHKPNERNEDGYTVAMLQAMFGKVPDKQWRHNKYLRHLFYIDEFKYGNMDLRFHYYTVQNILWKKHVHIPDEWKYKPLNNNEDNQAMIDACQGIVPELGNNDPSYQNKEGYTVAMYLAQNKIIPPKEWFHDPNLENCKNETVATILIKKRCLPPVEWMNDGSGQKDQSNYNPALKHFLGQVYVNGQFVPACKTQILNQTCQVCHNQGEQEFVVTKCKDIVCLKCYKENFKQRRFDECPICNKFNWYEEQ